MKLLTKNNRSLYLFEDSEVLTVSSNNVIVGEPPKLIIADCNSANAVIHENVTPPEDWTGCKYLYIDGVWSPDPTYVERPLSTVES